MKRRQEVEEMEERKDEVKREEEDTPATQPKLEVDAPPAEALELAEETPDTFVLEPNYPNPFNPRTTIRFGLPESAAVTLVVYDVLGRQVRVLVDGLRKAGMHEVVFEASNLPSGTYLYLLKTPKGSFSGSMLLLK